MKGWEIIITYNADSPQITSSCEVDAVFFIHIEVYRMGIAFTSSQKCSMLRISTTAMQLSHFKDVPMFI